MLSADAWELSFIRLKKLLYLVGIIMGTFHFIRMMKPKSKKKLGKNPLHKVDEAEIEEGIWKKPAS